VYVRQGLQLPKQPSSITGFALAFGTLFSSQGTRPEGSEDAKVAGRTGDRLAGGGGYAAAASRSPRSSVVRKRFAIQAPFFPALRGLPTANDTTGLCRTSTGNLGLKTPGRRPSVPAGPYFRRTNRLRPTWRTRPASSGAGSSSFGSVMGCPSRRTPPCSIRRRASELDSARPTATSSLGR